MRRIIKVDGPDPIDQYVGDRLRTLRMSLRMSQTKLGGALGVTFQQVQKYEDGTNRIGASNLYKSSKALGIDMNYFFEGAPENDGGARHNMSASTTREGNAMKSPDAVRFARDVMRVPDKNVRTRIRELLKAAVRAES